MAYMLGAGIEPMARLSADAENENRARFNALAQAAAHAGAMKRQMAGQRQMMLEKLGFDAHQADEDRGLKRYGIDQDTAARREQMQSAMGLEHEKLGQQGEQFKSSLGETTRHNTAQEGTETQRLSQQGEQFKSSLGEETRHHGALESNDATRTKQAGDLNQAQVEDLNLRRDWQQEDRDQDPQRPINRFKSQMINKIFGGPGSQGGPSTAPLNGDSEDDSGPGVPSTRWFTSGQGAGQPIYADNGRGPAYQSPNQAPPMDAGGPGGGPQLNAMQAQLLGLKSQEDRDYEKKVRDLGLQKLTREASGAPNDYQAKKEAAEAQSAMQQTFQNQVQNYMQQGHPENVARAKAAEDANNRYGAQIKLYNLQPIDAGGASASGPLMNVTPGGLTSRLQTLTGKQNPEDAMKYFEDKFATEHNAAGGFGQKYYNWMPFEPADMASVFGKSGNEEKLTTIPGESWWGGVDRPYIRNKIRKQTPNAFRDYLKSQGVQDQEMDPLLNLVK